MQGQVGGGKTDLRPGIEATGGADSVEAGLKGKARAYESKEQLLSPPVVNGMFIIFLSITAILIIAFTTVRPHPQPKRIYTSKRTQDLAALQRPTGQEQPLLSSHVSAEPLGSYTESVHEDPHHQFALAPGSTEPLSGHTENICKDPHQQIPLVPRPIEPQEQPLLSSCISTELLGGYTESVHEDLHCQFALVWRPTEPWEQPLLSSCVSIEPLGGYMESVHKDPHHHFSLARRPIEAQEDPCCHQLRATRPLGRSADLV